MNDIEALLLFLVYILPFGGIGNIIYGITENDKSKIILGIACVLVAIFIMGYLFCRLSKIDNPLAKQKKKLLVGLFKPVIGGCVLMIAEFLILWHFAVQFSSIMTIICITLVIMTIFSLLLQIS